MFAFQTPAALSDIARQLSTTTGLAVRMVAQIDSTNQALLDGAQELPLHPQSPCALIALKQSAGRGRRGRAWTVLASTENDTASAASLAPAFLGSLGVRTLAPLHSLSLLPLHIGVQVVQVLRAWGCPAQLKWPNDIVISTPAGLSKLGGILVETRKLNESNLESHHAIIMGMGLNWHSAPQLADKLTSHVAQFLPTLPNDVLACSALLGALALAWQRCVEKSDCHFAPYDALLNQTVTVINAQHMSEPATALGINSAGHLGVRFTSGPNAGQLHWLHSGEVSVQTIVNC